VPRRITQGRELSRLLSTNDAQSFGQSRTLRVKQLLGLDRSMANPDLAAPAGRHSDWSPIFIGFRGLTAQL
jgi:hypothetical protein